MLEVTSSALKHWITQAQIDYVFQHPVHMEVLQQEDNQEKILLMLGYTDEFKTRKIEILISSKTKKAFHAMECRPQWLHYFDE